MQVEDAPSQWKVPECVPMTWWGWMSRWREECGEWTDLCGLDFLEDWGGHCAEDASCSGAQHMGKAGGGRRGGVNDRSHCAANPRPPEANIFKNTLINIFMLRQQIFTGLNVINNINNARHAAVGEPAKSVVGQQLFHPHSISSPSPPSPLLPP